MLEIMALRAPVSPRPLAVTPERAAWLQRVAFALQVLLAARSGIPPHPGQSLLEGHLGAAGPPSRHRWLHGYLLLLLAPRRPRL